MLGTHKTTTTRTSNGVLIVTYQNTAVVEVHNNQYVILNNDGWYTPTTKRRMNQASEQYRLNFHVYQKNNEWFVKTPTQTAEYTNGIIINLKNGTTSAGVNQ